MIHQELNALVTPLTGKALIEASAGTGKTFTIATLYLRLLLGHGSSPFPRPLSVNEILVVTFTEAATEELKGRIRARIRDAKLAFSRGTTKDPILKDLIEDVQNAEAATSILSIAERQMDDCAIFTIHGFCQRMLTQFSLDTNTSSTCKLIDDEEAIKKQIVADFWRASLYTIDKDIASEVRGYWQTPSDLLGSIGRFLSGSAINIKTEEKSIGKSVEALHDQRLEIINNLKRKILNYEEDDLLSAIFNSGINKRSYTKTSTPKWVSAVFEWAREQNTGLATPSPLDKFASSTLLEKTQQGKTPSLDLFDDIEEFVSSNNNFKGDLLRLAITECRTKYRQLKDELNLISFDDLLSKLERALRGRSGEFLAEQIQSQYPFAMIDEFQDTDALQFSIFNSIYTEREDSELGLFMIGDPKQAIYAFRGADIHTYIKAKKSVDSTYTLSKNWRSTHEVVSSVNAVFNLSNNPFLYKDEIDFISTSSASAPNEKQWSKAGIEMAAMNIWNKDNDSLPVGKFDYESAMAANTANEINTLLTTEGSTLADGKSVRKIRAGDIAILVRTGRQAGIVQEALEKKNIPSVYLSSNGSVYDSDEARDLLLFLRCISNTKDERSVRAALSTSLFGLTAQELDELNRDENKWDRKVQELTGYLLAWTYNGVSAAIRKFITDNELPKKLQSRIGGERSLTNLLHLAELLQNESSTIDNNLSLLQLLDDHISSPNTNSEEQQLRLESDKNLVKVITIHKSKGLEYNLVFLPFAMSFQDVKVPLYYDESLEKMVLDLDQTDESMSLADIERTAEDLRILYVALTRSVYGAYLGVCPIQDGRRIKGNSAAHKSGLGFLIQGGEKLPAEGFLERLMTLVDSSEHIALISDPEDTVATSNVYSAEGFETPKKARIFQGDIEKNWWVTSFSSLSRHTSSHDASSDMATLEPELFDKDKKNEPSQGHEQLEQSIFTFPRGAAIGTFLHTIFEEIDYTKPASCEETTHTLRSLMEINSIDPEWETVLLNMISTTLTTPMDNKGFTLDTLTSQSKLVEMEFLIPIEHLNCDEFNSILLEYEELYSQGNHLAFDDVKGLLKGFIDLTFYHDGKYYVLDWKSNHLGDEIEAYSQGAMSEAIADHRYDVQYNLYTLALHRFLGKKISNYDYNTHVGGCYYIFLRGLQSGTDFGIYFKKPKLELIEELDTLFTQDN